MSTSPTSNATTEFPQSAILRLFAVRKIISAPSATLMAALSDARGVRPGGRAPHAAGLPGRAGPPPFAPRYRESALVEEFPWVDVLPPADRGHFAADFVRAVAASAELGEWSVLAQVVREWKATAAIHADPVLVDELSRPLDDDFWCGGGT